jgi:ubiquitin carboxyl-terminal hydrolase 47
LNEIDIVLFCRDGERLQIELGRALRDGEYKCKLYFLKLSEINDEMEKMPYLCETILRYGAEVGQTKREILAHIATLDPKYNIPYDKCRLRRKSYKNPSKIFLDDQKFGDDIMLTTSYEVSVFSFLNGRNILKLFITDIQMVLQEIESSSQPCLNDEDTVLFVRRWFPSTLTLGEFQEITIGG